MSWTNSIMEFKEQNVALREQKQHHRVNFYNKILYLLLSVFMFCGNAKAQDGDNTTINDLNGIWRNREDNSVYYSFNNGKYISFYLAHNGSVDILDYGNYGFYSKNFNYAKYKKSGLGLYKVAKETDSLAIIDNKGFFIGYEFETGDRVLNLYNQNPFFYEKLYVLSQKIIVQLKNIAKEKKIDIDDFIYSIETIGSTKAIIYSIPNIATKMYLVKDNRVKIIAENGNWLKFEYKGKRVITGWIKKKDLQ